MVNILVLRAPGTNCDQETAYAFEQSGGKAERLHVNRVLENPNLLDEFQILCFPGGFSFGDDVAAGKILANLLKIRLGDPLRKFKDAGKLILGICNGFQILIKSGLLLDEQADSAPATLTWNRSGVYTDRWVKLQTAKSNCVFLRGVDSLYLPIAHAEGQFITRNEDVLSQLKQNENIALRYASGDNPNGSQDDIAGVCDTTGRVFGLMPHPERHLDPLQHPHWTRILPKDRPQFGDGMKIFKNAVEYFR